MVSTQRKRKRKLKKTQKSAQTRNTTLEIYTRRNAGPRGSSTMRLEAHNILTLKGSSVGALYDELTAWLMTHGDRRNVYLVYKHTSTGEEYNTKFVWRDEQWKQTSHRPGRRSIPSDEYASRQHRWELDQGLRQNPPNTKKKAAVRRNDNRPLNALLDGINHRRY